MNKNKQIIALAEFEGWKDISANNLHKPTLFLGNRPEYIDGEIHSYTVDKKLPNYPEDLNAIHRLEKKLDSNQLPTYTANIRKLLDKKYELDKIPISYYCADAEIRCAAILETIDKWTEN